MTSFQSLIDVADYLNKCRPRKLITGDWSFEVHNTADRTGEIREFFVSHPEYQISINGAQRFITLSDRTLVRLNAQLPDENKVTPANPVVIVNKYR